MKKLILTLVAIATISLSSFGQAPEAFKYQAVIRDAGNTILNNQAVGMQITILQGAITGATVYEETFSPTTNGYGLVNLEIGSGTVVFGDLTTIDWSAGPYFIETAVDVTGGTSYVVMGTSQLLSVPYALYAKTAENVTNDAINDADADPTNEMNTGVVLNGTDLEVTDGNGTIVTDLSSLQDGVNDADADPNNEIQTISRTGTTVTLSNGGSTFEDSVGVYTAGSGIDISNNVISTSGTCGLAIGDTYQGGIIFYLDASGCHGLISAPTDQSTGIQWFNGSYVDTYAYGNGIGAGEGNSQGIKRFQGNCASCYANELCQDLILGGFLDWYLPSKYELYLMYQNIGQGNALGLGNIGGFAGDYYWSSTEGDDMNAWYLRFLTFSQGFASKNSSLYVRAIRAF